MFENTDLGRPKIQFTLKPGDTVEIYVRDMILTGAVQSVDIGTDNERLVILAESSPGHD